MRISIDQAAKLLNSGEVVAVPTETVYGLAASLAFPQAIERIFKLKGRPSSNPLIVHMSDWEVICEYADCLPEHFMALAKAFWPGPMTLVLPAQLEKVPAIVRAGLPTAAFRVPMHAATLNLLGLTGPLVMPSANLSGTPSATNADHVEADFGHDFPVLEGSESCMGLESTILIHIDGIWQIIRQGALPPSAFDHVLGYPPPLRQTMADAAPICPGQLFRHYAPKAQLEPSKNCLQAQNKTILGFCDRTYPSSNRVISLGRSTHPQELAENLYATLRSLDALEVKAALVDIDLPNKGLYATLLERLDKASRGP